jgi:hypothetical protein
LFHQQAEHPGRSGALAWLAAENATKNRLFAADVRRSNKRARRIEPRVPNHSILNELRIRSFTN